jgi:hypothetical protein
MLLLVYQWFVDKHRVIQTPALERFLLSQVVNLKLGVRIYLRRLTHHLCRLLYHLGAVMMGRTKQVHHQTVRVEMTHNCEGQNF